MHKFFREILGWITQLLGFALTEDMALGTNAGIMQEIMENFKFKTFNRNQQCHLILVRIVFGEVADDDLSLQWHSPRTQFT